MEKEEIDVFDDSNTTDTTWYNSSKDDLLSLPNEKISFTSTEKVRITVRNLTIGSSTSAITTYKSKLSNIFQKNKQTADIESNNSIKTILHPMSFDIPESSLTCIIGGSGSGKTTLLNCLANRKFNSGTMFKEGDVRYNSSSTLESYRHAYVTQQDILIPTLTCYETLMYAAELKLPKLSSHSERSKLVEEIILTLGLKECKQTLVGNQENKGLSGGERRRLSVGLQMVSNPSVLFLDEPTTGLDNYNAYLLCKSFQYLANKLGKTIIMSIHQPREDIFKLFDTVLILSKGNLCYGSSHADLFNHFNFLGYGIPQTKVNPGDFFIDITTVDTRTPKNEIESTNRVDMIIENWKINMSYLENIENLDLESLNSYSGCSIFQEVGKAPFFRELKILIKRNLKLQYRDPIGWASVLFEALILGLGSGWLFYNPGTSPAGIRSIESSLYTSCSLSSYLFLLYETYRLCTNDLRIFDRERMDKSISIPGFLLARRITKFFTEDLWISVLYSVTTYYMYGLRTDSAKYFFKYFACCLISTVNTMTFATFAASISRNVSTTSLINNINFTLQSMTNGLFANARQLPVYVRWFKYVAYLWYSYGFLVSNQFTDFNGECYIINANDPDVNNICFQSSGDYIIKDLGFWKNWNVLPICVLLAFTIGNYVAAGVILYLFPQDMSMGKETKLNDSTDDSIDYEQPIQAPNINDNPFLTEQEKMENNNFISVTVNNINLKVENRLDKSSKDILKNVSGTFAAGKLNVIMGPSGSGKTSLLNLMSGRLGSNSLTKYSCSGEIYLNQYHIEDYQMMRPICSYVIQEDDHLVSSITVRETLMFAAKLRLSKSKLSEDEKKCIVEDIILKMGLKNCANTMVGGVLIKGISGGEKRRVSIAIQLISSPKILFLDEPTSGLDSFTAASIIECLHNLTIQGTTIIMTIHQPRSLDSFGSILLLSKGGKVAFNGTQDDLISHFAYLGFPVPELTNVADYVIDLISYNTSNHFLEYNTKARVEFLSESWKCIDETSIPQNSVILNNRKDVQKIFHAVIKEPAGFLTGFVVLVKRQWIGLIRNKDILFGRISLVVGLAIILSLFFARLKDNTTSVQDRLGLIQQFTALYFTGVLNNVASYPQQRDYFYAEYNDDVVGLNSFFFSYLALEIPFEIISSLIFAIMVVFVIGLQSSASLFFTAFYCTILVVNAGESLGISFNTAFNHAGFALNIILIFCSIGVAMAGLLAMTLDNFSKSLNYLSPLHYCVMLVANNVFTPALKLTCTSLERLPNGECQYTNGSEVLEAFDLEVNQEIYFIMIAVVVILQRIISWVFLRVKLARTIIGSSKLGKLPKRKRTSN